MLPSVFNDRKIGLLNTRTLLVEDHPNGPVSDQQAENKPMDTPAPKLPGLSWRSSLRSPTQK